MTAPAATLGPTFVTDFRGGTLTAAQLDAILPAERAAIIFLLLQLSTSVAGRIDAPAGTAHSPSGSLPPYATQRNTSRTPRTLPSCKPQVDVSADSPRFGRHPQITTRE